MTGKQRAQRSGSGEPSPIRLTERQQLPWSIRQYVEDSSTWCVRPPIDPPSQRMMRKGREKRWMALHLSVAVLGALGAYALPEAWFALRLVCFASAVVCSVLYVEHTMNPHRR